MKTPFFIFILTVFWGINTEIHLNQTGKEKAPALYFNNFTNILKEGASINCRKINDMGVVIFLNDEMKKQDLFKIELHRFVADADVMVAYKNFKPNSQEFQNLFSEKDSLRLLLLTPEDDFNKSDFEPNTFLFSVETLISEIVCEHNPKHNSFYLVVKGYNKTGKTNKFGDELMDNGKEISERSVVFKNWGKQN